MRREVRLSGFGGQGIILAGEIVGKAAALYDHKFATFTQVYGPESRGGACAADVVIDDKPVHFPHAISPDVLVVMSQGAYAKYVPGFKREGLLIIDEDLVRLDRLADGVTVLSVPSTQMAEAAGRKLVANIVMLGFVSGVTDLVTVDSMRQAVLASIPRGSEALNTRAFDAGLEHAGKRCPPADGTW